METRILGKTGYKATILTLGGCGLGSLSQEEADKAIQQAINEGINIIDVAPSYGHAEKRLKALIEKFRSNFFLAEKTLKRTKKEAWEELEHSLLKLGTNYFDLYQFHAVRNQDELKQIFSKNGAFQAFIEAKKMGLIKHIGITGHRDVRILLKAVETYDFDTVLLPVSMSIFNSLHPANDFRPLLKEAKDKDIGIIAIKAISKGRWIGEKTYSTWYEPMTQQRDVDMAINFTLSQNAVTTYSLPCDVKLWGSVFKAVDNFTKMTQHEQVETIDYIKKRNFQPLYPESD